MSLPKTLDELREELKDSSRFTPSELYARHRYIKKVESGLCVYCDKNPRSGTTRSCVECKLKSGHSDKKYSVEWRIRKSLAGLCSHCGKEPAAEDRKLCFTCRDYFKRKTNENYHKNNKARRLSSKRVLVKLKIAVFNAYGGAVCACCSEKTFQFLTLDHLENNGAKHRKELFGRRTGGRLFYSWLKRATFPPGYQVLCMNCNWGKHVNGGICPHQQKAA